MPANSRELAACTSPAIKAHDSITAGDPQSGISLSFPSPRRLTFFVFFVTSPSPCLSSHFFPLRFRLRSGGFSLGGRRTVFTKDRLFCCLDGSHVRAIAHQSTGLLCAENVYARRRSVALCPSTLSCKPETIKIPFAWINHCCPLSSRYHDRWNSS